MAELSQIYFNSRKNWMSQNFLGGNSQKVAPAPFLYALDMAARLANSEQLQLSFSTGSYVPAYSRNGKWGTGAIEAISKRLQMEVPGVRVFSPVKIKNMRLFSENWMFLAESNRQLATDDLTPEDNNAFLHTGGTF